MDTKVNVCQSCGLPLTENNMGTNNDMTSNEEYCRYCYDEGEFMIPNLTLDNQIERLAEMAIENMKMTEKEARSLAEEVLPGLKRWKVK